MPSGSGSAYQMAARWKDSYQGDLSPWWFWQLCFCSVWGRCPAERGEQTLRCAQLSAQLSARLCSLDWSCFHTTLSQYTFYGPWIESFQDCWWDPGFPQLSQMVQSLPGFLFFCYQHFFYFFSHTTSQHNIHSKQTKLNNRHILHILKVQSKGRERGRGKSNNKTGPSFI